jgi:NADH pyrophosphatase NudC (nudix superfamily)
VTRPQVRDSIVPGSARTVTYHEDVTYVTVQCGRCGHRQEARATSKTARCKECNRSCRIGTPAAGPNVLPFIRRSA